MRERVEALIAARGAGPMTSGYRYCDLTLASDWPLCGLPLTDATVAEAEHAPDLEIVLGSVPRSLPDEQRRTATFAHNGREALWWLDGIGRCWISADGRRIRVQPESEPEPEPSADPLGDQDHDADGDSHANALGLMLLQPLMALAAVRRGDWMLNAAAVERNGQVFAFIGPSASGKSTAAALLIKRGFRLVSDGLLRVTRSADGEWLAHPQASWLQLWPDALKHLGLDEADLNTVRPGLRLTRWPSPCITEPLPLARIGLLREQRGNDLEDFVPSARAPLATKAGAADGTPALPVPAALDGLIDWAGLCPAPQSFAEAIADKQDLPLRLGGNLPHRADLA